MKNKFWFVTILVLVLGNTGFGQLGDFPFTVTPIPYNPPPETGTDLNRPSFFDPGQYYFGTVATPPFYTSEYIPIGFSFSFGGVGYNFLMFNPHGVLNLQRSAGTVATPTMSADFNALIPNNNTAGQALIFGSFQRINPNISRTPPDPFPQAITYRTDGEAPYRRFVISFVNLLHTGTVATGVATDYQTSQIVLYETTQVIEVYIKNRTPNAVNPDPLFTNGFVGIQNRVFPAVGTAPSPPLPDRNGGNWSTTNEAWCFTPSDAVDGNLQDKLIPDQDMYLCKDAGITNYPFDLTSNISRFFDPMPGNIGSYTVTFYDGVTPITNPAGYTITEAENNKRITAKVQPNITSTCFVPEGQITFRLIIQDAPDIPTIPDMTVQVADCTAIGTNIDLTAHYTGPTVPAGYTVEYFLDNARTIPIDDPTRFDMTRSNRQTIYVTLTNRGICSVNIQFELVVVQQAPELVCTPLSPPVAGFCEPLSQQACETIFGTGTAVFHLRDNDALIAPDLLKYKVTYYSSLADATNGVGSLPDDYTNATPNRETIYARVDYICNGPGVVPGAVHTTVDLSLRVNPIPMPPPVLPVVFGSCETGTVTFTLSGIDNQMTSGLAGVSVRYYLTEPEARAGAGGAILDHSTAVPITIYGRLENVTGCFTVVPLRLTPGTGPVLPTNVVQYVCDADITSQQTFVLQDNDVRFNGGLVGHTVSYYETEAQANVGDPGTRLPLGGFLTVSRIVWARVDVAVAGGAPLCFAVVPLQLEVVPPPVENPVGPLVACEIAGGGGLFDLTNAEIQFIGTQANIEVTFHPSFVDAQNNTAPIAGLVGYASGTTTLGVRVHNSLTGCTTVTTLDLQVNLSPSVIPPYTFSVSETGNATLAIFNLRTQDRTLQDGQRNVIVTYYETLFDAQHGTNIIGDPGHFNNHSNPQTIGVRLTNTVTGCFSTTTLNLFVSQYPIIPDPITPLINCLPAVEYDRQATAGTFEGDFLLSHKDAEITGGNTNYVVRYYETAAEASALAEDLTAIPPVPGPGPGLDATIPRRVSGLPKTIHVRLDHRPPGPFFSTGSFQLNVRPIPELLSTEETLFVCDDNADGIATFNLEASMPGFVRTPGNYRFQFFETEEDLLNNVNEIETPTTYTNIVPNRQGLFVKISDRMADVCFKEVSLRLEVRSLPRPILPLPFVYEACSDPRTIGTGVFDLITFVTAEPSLAPYTLGLYQLRADAEEGDPLLEIGTPTNFLSSGETIYIRVFDPITFCFMIVELPLVVNPLPVLKDPIPEYSLCHVSGVVTGGVNQEPFDLETWRHHITDEVGVTFLFYELNPDGSMGRQIGDIDPNEVNAYVNIENPQSIGVHVVSIDNGCIAQTQFDIRVLPLPLPLIPTDPIELCDVAGSGFASFDLDALIPGILNGAAPAVFSVTFHDLEDNAKDNLDPLPLTYENTTPVVQTIWVRTTNTGTGCFVVGSIELWANPSPTIATIPVPTIVLCDVTAPFNDGITSFDLTVRDPLVLGPLDPMLYTVRYFTDEDDAVVGSGPTFIVDATNYVNTSNPQTIWVRLTNNATGCYTISQFQLQVHLPFNPGSLSYQMSVCSTTVPTGVFDLTLMTEDILAGSVGYTVTYYRDPLHTDLIPNLSTFTNTSNPQTLYVMVTDDVTGCAVEIVSTLRALPFPSVTPSASIPPLESCDMQPPHLSSGLAVFDLVSHQHFITTDPIVDVKYYETYAAGMVSDEIDTPTAYVSGSKAIYVQVSTPPDVSGEVCRVVVSMDLVVHPVPTSGSNLGVIKNYLSCIVGSTGVDNFDLTSKNDEILGGQNPANFVVSYHESEAEAVTGTGNLLTPYRNRTNPQTIHVRVFNIATGCVNALGFFELRVEEGALANSVTDFAPICDTDGVNDGVFMVDLTNGGATTTTVLWGQDPAVYRVTYHTSLADAEAGLNGIGTPATFANTGSPVNQTIWLRVTNTLSVSGCYAVTHFSYQVNKLPEPVLSTSNHYLCMDLDTGLALRPVVLDAGLLALHHNFTWYRNGALIPGATGKEYETAQSGIYEVRVTHTATGCASRVGFSTLEIKETSAAVIVDAVLVNNFTDDRMITVVVRGTGSYEFQLNDGPFQSSPVFYNVPSGTHRVTVRDVFGGCDPISKIVMTINYPNFFTPNGDGQNDTWNITDLADQPNALISIFDRFGKLLMIIRPSGLGWDGTFQGQQMPATDYWFLLQYEENGEMREFRSHFSLLR